MKRGLWSLAHRFLAAREGGPFLSTSRQPEQNRSMHELKKQEMPHCMVKLALQHWQVVHANVKVNQAHLSLVSNFKGLYKFILSLRANVPPGTTDSD